MKKIFLLLVLFGILGCGKTPEQKVTDTISRANFLLTSRQCQEAINILEALGRQTANPNYIVTLASAYACKAGYSSTTFFAQDISKITADNSTFGGVAAMTTSDDSVSPSFYDDTKVNALLSAINVLLYAGGAIDSAEEPTYAKRLEIYGNDGGDINSFAMYLILAHLGKFYHYFGDASVNLADLANPATKAGGALAGTCMTSYTNAEAILAEADVDTYLSAANTGSCDSVSGSVIRAEINDSATNRRALLCQAIVGFNNLYELLPFVLADAAGTDLSTISGVTASITAVKTALTTDFTNGGAGASDQAALAATIIVQSQEACETSTTINLRSLEAYFLLLVESTFK